MLDHDWLSENGASAVEYGLLISGIAAVVFAVILLFGGFVGSLFSDTCDDLNAQRTAHGQSSATCQ